MIIQGILDNSLNGQLCIRGFAKIKDLARLSEADYSYQRDLIDRTDISDFLDTQEFLFFPEVILSYKFKHKFSPKKDIPLKSIQEGKKYESEINHDSIIVKSIQSKSALIKTMRLAMLNITECDSNIKPFHRIDGNHRLTAAENLESDKIQIMTVPFCILLGTDFFDNNGNKVENDDTYKFDKATKVFFYNINSKTIPLTSEENLRVMIDDECNFGDDELKEIFGGEYPLLTRELIHKVDKNIFTGISHVLDKNYRTYYNALFKRMLNDGYKRDECVNKLLTSLQAVNTLYNENPLIKANKSIGLLFSFIWYHMEGIEKFNSFRNWILGNHLFEVSEEVSENSIIKLFDKIYSQEIKVFVAMPYFDGNPDIVADYNTIYDNKIKEIAERYNVNISLFPIMCAKGETHDQIQDIINKIKKAKIVFADITDNNANVLYEMGWARALEDKQVIIVRRKGSTKPKSDYQNDTYHEYDDSCRSTSLSKVIEDNILEVLEKNYGLIKRN